MKHSLRFLAWTAALILTGAAHAQSVFTDGSSTFENASAATQEGTGVDAVRFAAPPVEGDLVAVAIPEPETYTLLIAGIALLGLVKRRKSAA